MVVVEKSLPAGAQHVFAVLCDPETYPDWLTGAKYIRNVDRSFPNPSANFEHEVGAGPITVRDTTEVEEVHDLFLKLEVRARPFLVASVTFEVVPVDEAASLLRMSESPTGIYRMFFMVIDPLIKVRNTRSLDRLAAFLRSADQ